MARRAKGEGSVYKRADGRWVGQLPNGYYPNGRRRYARIVRTTQAEVVEAMREARASDVIPTRSTTVKAYLAWWLESGQGDDIAESTVNTYRVAVDNWVVPYVGRHRLCDLTPDHVRGMLRSLKDRGLSPASRAQARRVLGRALKVAASDGKVTRNVVTLVDGPKLGKEAKLDDAMSREQCAAVLSAAADDPFEAAAMLGLRLGLRIGEVIALRWSDVDEGELHVRRSKTASGLRTIPLVPAVAQALRARRRHQAAEQLKAGPLWRDTDYVFTNARGEGISDASMRQWWHRLCERAGVGHHRFHASRHTCATLLLDDGVALEVVSAILGHAGLSITADIYARVTKDSMRKALGQLERASG